MTTRITNPTNEIKKPMPRLDERWWDGIKSGETIVVGSMYDVRRLLNSGCVEVIEAKIPEKTEDEPTIPVVIAEEKPKRKRKTSSTE